MKTVIQINGLPVEFSDQKPTSPGAYWWNRSENRAEPDLVTVGYLFDPSVLDVMGPWGVISVQHRDGLWSAPLVPVTEVEKAYQEGFISAHHKVNDSVKSASIEAFEESNARMVVEGSK